MRSMTTHNAIQSPSFEKLGSVRGHGQRHGGVIQHARHDNAGGGRVGAVAVDGIMFVRIKGVDLHGLVEGVLRGEAYRKRAWPARESRRAL